LLITEPLAARDVILPSDGAFVKLAETCFLFVSPVR